MGTYIIFYEDGMTKIIEHDFMPLASHYPSYTLCYVKADKSWYGAYRTSARKMEWFPENRETIPKKCLTYALIMG